MMFERKLLKECVKLFKISFSTGTSRSIAEIRPSQRANADNSGYLPILSRDIALASTSTSTSSITGLEFLENQRRLVFPTANRLKLYSFPVLHKPQIFAPTATLLIEKVDPKSNIVPKSMPNNNLVIPMFADRKWRIIRRHRMVKFKRRKRIDRDWFQYQKKHTKKKQKAEMIFRSRMNEILKELETFDPLTYIDETIERANRDLHLNVAPSGRKKYPHWSEFTSLEELYGVPKGDYIDKRYGLPVPEERKKIEELRKDYLNRYTIKNIKDYKNDQNCA